MRRNYVVSRLALFVLFVGFSTLALNPIVRLGIVNTGQSITGARIDVQKVRSALAKGYVTLEDVQAADPQHPMRNLFEAKHMRLEVDTEALKRRQFVVTEATASGFRLGTQRAAPGTLDVAAKTEYNKNLVDRFTAVGGQWLHNAARMITEDTSSQYQSRSLFEQLSQRWPQDQAQIDSNSTYVRDRIAEIQKLIDESGENPLRNLQPYQQAIAELELLQKEAFEATGGMNRLRQQLMMDKGAIEEARKKDEEFVSRQRQIESLEGSELSEFLVGPEVNNYVSEIVNWVRWGRKQIPSGSGVPLAKSGRGETIFFPGIEAEPETVIEKFAFRGTGLFGGAPLQLEGAIRGLSSHPQLNADPIELSMSTLDGSKLTVQATLNQQNGQSHDVVLVRCPNLPGQQRILGDPNKLAVKVSPSATQLWVRLALVDDKIDGELILKQSGVELSPQLAPSFGGDHLSQLSSTMLTGVDQIETRAQLSGTMANPTCVLESSLGPQLASGLSQAVAAAAKQHQYQSLVSTYASVDETIAQLDQVYQSKSHELVAQFEVGRQQIESIHEIIATRVERNDGVTNREWPLRESFRR